MDIQKTHRITEFYMKQIAFLCVFVTLCLLLFCFCYLIFGICYWYLLFELMQHTMFKLFFIFFVVEDRYYSADAYYGYADYCEQIGNVAEEPPIH